ncbi:MAG TPA: hypothetical protein VM554_09350 [Acidisarcina sp.]|nr:hypothetical protein [Acidisarcina sp.]
MTDPFTCNKEQAITRFKNALLLVAPEYFCVELPDGSQACQERVFAYELYHQVRLQFTEYWYVNGEFRKGLSLVPRVNRRDWVIPDLVIHQPATIENNLVAVEIKSSPDLAPTDLLADLKKLEMFTDPEQGLGFAIGIMLIVNADFNCVFSRASDDVKASIAQILEKGPRVAIWNIARPEADGDYGDGRLGSNCLTIFKACDVSKRLASQAR